jgi:hypothetical protein
MGGDWTQTVCSGCYVILVRAQREEAKKAAKANRYPMQAKHRRTG